MLETKIDCAVLLKITGIIRTTFVDSCNWGISESSIVADEKLNRSKSISILLGADVFVEVRRHNKKAGPPNYRTLPRI
jgi:hypothetical protein